LNALRVPATRGKNRIFPGYPQGIDMAKAIDRHDAEELFCSHLARLLKDYQMVPADLAEKLHVQPSYVRRLQHGEKKPSLQMLGRIARALDCEVWQFFYRDAD
jgi:transcriptional regulator with XRE-family HTH domain